MFSFRIGLVAVSLLAITARPAVAGVADSPLPLLGGEQSKHVFTVPGVVQNASLATTFLCTSLEKSKNLRFAVEVFASAGGAPEAPASSVVLSPGGTKAITVGGTTYQESLGPAVADSSDPRSARIVATSKKLTCTVAVLERQALNGSLPTVAFSLTVIKKTSQKGD